jgi:hypothetical protein
LRIPISDQTKQEVITKWLSGWPRDKIAGEVGLGAGTVTNIIAKWTDDVGTPTASAVRELSIEIRRAGMTIRDCARGLRIMKILPSRIADDDIKHFELFIDKVYNKCKYFNISPEHIVEIASEIWELSRIIPVSRIPSYLDEKMKVKQDLEAEVKRLNTEREFAKIDLNNQLYRVNTTSEELKEYLSARNYLSKYGLGKTDIHKLVLALQNGEKYGFDLNQIVNEITRIQSLHHEGEELRKKVAEDREALKMTEYCKKEAEKEIDQRLMMVKSCDDLKSIGFGLDQLTRLKNTLEEIAEVNDTKNAATNPKDVIDLFFKKVEESRNLERRIELLKEERNRIEEISSSILDTMKDSIRTMIGQATKEVKEMSNMAIEAIKTAYERE